MNVSPFGKLNEVRLPRLFKSGFFGSLVSLSSTRRRKSVDESIAKSHIECRFESDVVEELREIYRLDREASIVFGRER